MDEPSDCIVTTETRRSRKVCERDGRREPDLRRRPANPALPGRKRRSQSPWVPALLTPALRRAGPAVSSLSRAAARCGLPRCRHGLGLRLHSGEGEITLPAANGPALLGSLSPLWRGRASGLCPQPERPPPTDQQGGTGARHPPPEHPQCPLAFDLICIPGPSGGNPGSGGEWGDGGGTAPRCYPLFVPLPPPGDAPGGS